MSDRVTNTDTDRLRWFAQHSGMDGFAGIDIHEEASISASFFGRDEANSDDYLAAIRSAIDIEMENQKG